MPKGCCSNGAAYCCGPKQTVPRGSDARVRRRAVAARGVIERGPSHLREGKGGGHIHSHLARDTGAHAHTHTRETHGNVRTRALMTLSLNCTSLKEIPLFTVG